MFRDKIDVYSQSQSKPMNTLSGRNTEKLYVKVDSYSM
jgi:hypothetical protein